MPVEEATWQRHGGQLIGTESHLQLIARRKTETSVLQPQGKKFLPQISELRSGPQASNKIAALETLLC